ncbi:MAG: hypothetical protein ACI8UP_001080, partial [Porticoccaceae bacterium]
GRVGTDNPLNQVFYGFQHIVGLWQGTTDNRSRQQEAVVMKSVSIARDSNDLQRTMNHSSWQWSR